MSEKYFTRCCEKNVFAVTGYVLMTTESCDERILKICQHLDIVICKSVIDC